MVVLAFVVPVILIILLVTFVTGQKVGGAGTEAMTPEAIAERLRPVGTVAFAGAPVGPRALQSGEAVYKLACSACHATGAAGAPKAGDDAAWAPRIKQGYDTLVKHAVEGFKAMPPRAAMPISTRSKWHAPSSTSRINRARKFKEPEAPAATAAAKAPARTGEQIVQQTCGNCHTAGLNGAPKIGDRAAWTKRASTGIDAAVASAIKGHGGMPSRGGMSDLTDAELKSAVQYMFIESTGCDLGCGDTCRGRGAAAAPPAATSPMARRSTRWAAMPATRPVSPARRSSATRPPGPRAARRASTACVASVTKGKGAMPPKGGQASASDADLRAAVEYMLAAAK